MGEMGVGTVASAINQNAPQINYNSDASAQAALVEGQNRAREVRPVENTGDSAQAKTQSEETTSKTTIEDRVIVFRRYDDDGNVVSRVPPTVDEEV